MSNYTIIIETSTKEAADMVVQLMGNLPVQELKRVEIIDSIQESTEFMRNRCWLKKFGWSEKRPGRWYHPKYRGASIHLFSNGDWFCYQFGGLFESYLRLKFMGTNSIEDLMRHVDDHGFMPRIEEESI